MLRSDTGSFTIIGKEFFVLKKKERMGDEIEERAELSTGKKVRLPNERPFAGIGGFVLFVGLQGE